MLLLSPRTARCRFYKIWKRPPPAGSGEHLISSRNNITVERRPRSPSYHEARLGRPRHLEPLLKRAADRGGGTRGQLVCPNRVWQRLRLLRGMMATPHQTSAAAEIRSHIGTFQCVSMSCPQDRCQKGDRDDSNHLMDELHA